VLLLTLTVPPAGAGVAGAQQSTAPSISPGISDGGNQGANASDRGARRARRRADNAIYDGIPIESIARARQYLRCRAAGEQPTAHAVRGWETFYAACDRCIRGFAGALGVRGADLDDCAQDVWADLMRSLPRFELDRSRGRFTSWLYAIVRSKVIDQDRRRARKPACQLSPEIAGRICAGIEPNPLLACERSSERERVRAAMAKLRMRSSEKSYRVLHLRYWEGLSASQVATALGLTPQQVWVREHRMKKKLGALLACIEEPTTRCA
jgi:RNA polymerase sigma factor (sigma-70 family)